MGDAFKKAGAGMCDAVQNLGGSLIFVNRFLAKKDLNKSRMTHVQSDG
jgi:hypothetical protein